MGGGLTRGRLGVPPTKGGCLSLGTGGCSTLPRGASNGLAFEVQDDWRLPDTSLVGFAVGPDGQFAGAYFDQGAS